MSPLLLALAIASATVYSWTDKSGVEHFTDDLSSIPRGVKVRTTEGAEISRIDSNVAKNPPPALVAQPAPPAAPSPSEQAWRQLFKDARNEVKNLEDEIESDRKKVEELNGLPVSRPFTCSNAFYGGGPLITSGSSVVVTGQPLPASTWALSGTSFVSQGAPFYAAPCFGGQNPEWERLRERLDKNRRGLVRAREALADLERRAAIEAVPLHWRR